MSVLSPTSQIEPNAIQVAICLCAYHSSFLLLLRNPHKPLGLLWCAPGGKLGSNEPPDIGALRELQEETTIKAALPDLNPLGSYLMSYEGDIYQFHLYLNKMESKEEKIHLAYEEHIAFTWAEFSQIETLELMPGLFEILEIGSSYIKGSSLLSP